MKWKLVKESDEIVLKYRKPIFMDAECELSPSSFYLAKLRNYSWTKTDSIHIKSEQLVGNRDDVKVIITRREI
jgi:hypothetical protein